LPILLLIPCGDTYTDTPDSLQEANAVKMNNKII